MLLTFYIHVSYLLVVFVGYLFLSFPAKSLSTFADFLDTLCRSESSDFFLNTFYLWWTNLYYLPTLFVLFVLCLILYNNLPSLTALHLAVFVLILWCWLEIADHWHLNPSQSRIGGPSEGFNVLLSNSINNYHPLIFYSAVGLSFVSVSRSSIKLALQYNSLLILTFTLFLGSWWAYQEGSWGGWWNWDPSEVLGLLASLYVVRSIHFSLASASTSPVYSLAVFYVNALLLAYMFIQLNFNLVSHNFGTNPDSSVGPAMMLLSMSTALVLSQGIWSVSCYSLSVLNLGLLAPNPFPITAAVSNVPVITLLVFVFFLFYLSFLPILNDFFGSFLGASLVTNLTSVSSYVLGVLVLLLAPFWRVSISKLFITPVLVYVGLPVYAFVLNTHLVRRFREIFHFSLTLFLLTCVVSNLTTTSLWYAEPLCAPSPNYLGLVNDFFGYSPLLSYPFFESSLHTLSSNTLSESVWGFENRGSSVTRYLSHYLLPDYVTQSLHTGNSSFPFTVTTFDLTSQLLATILFILLTSLFQHVSRPAVIKF